MTPHTLFMEKSTPFYRWKRYKICFLAQKCIVLTTEMVNVAQLVEHQIVALVVVGSIPIIHPNFLNVNNYAIHRRHDNLLVSYERIFQIMKHIFSSEIFWGSILIIFGLSVLIKAIFGIDLPLMRVIFGGLLIYLGFSMVTSWKNYSHCGKNSRTIWFSTISTTPDTIKSEYRVSFSSIRIDLRSVPIDQIPSKIFIDAHCSSVLLITNPDVPTLINIDARFASTKLPNNETVAVGNTVYMTHDQQVKPVLEISANLVMSNFEIY